MQKFVDIVIVGSGFSGLAIASYLRRSGRHDFVILERAHDVGGTWRDNSYPGCACDVPSHLYSFSFAPNPDWSSTFSAQSEIHKYLRKVAKQEHLMQHITFGTEFLGAKWHKKDKLWHIRTSGNSLKARILINAAGPLSTPTIPHISGMERFSGPAFHSAQWEHGVTLKNKRIAVLGTGASAIQFVPEIQPSAKQIYIFQRSAPWVLPRTDRRITKLERSMYRTFPLTQRIVRMMIYWTRELYAIPLLRGAFAPVLKVTLKLRLRRLVHDPKLRAALTPPYTPGCKRILISNAYLPAVTKPNVEVISSAVASIKGNTVVSKSGLERDVDVIVFGTGFQATEPPIAKLIRGEDGQTLHEHWQDGMQALRGTGIAGFPNFFFMLGPNTGLGHTSLVFMAETQARYIVQALEYLEASGKKSLHPNQKSQAKWTRQIRGRMKKTVWLTGGCSSWYLDKQGSNTVLWPDFTFRFRKQLAKFDPSEYHFS